MSIISRAIERFDQWYNLATGFGTDRDRTSYRGFAPHIRIDNETLGEMYDASALVQRLVGTFPEEALRQGVMWSDRGVELQERLATTGALTEINEAAQWGRLFGVGVVWLKLSDLAHDQPVTGVPAPVVDVEAFDAREIQRTNDPQVYRITCRGRSTHVHRSRLIQFDGVTTTRRSRDNNQGFANGVIQSMYPTIGAFEEAYSNLGSLLSSSVEGVLKMQGLRGAISSQGKEGLAARMRFFDLYRSSLRTIVLDDGEEYKRDAVPLNNVPEIADRFARRLSAESGIPVEILIGQSPAGLNATGDSSIRLFYDRVRTYQTNVMKPRLERLAWFLVPGARVNVSFPSLWQESPAEKEARESAKATKSATLVQSEIMSPEEVALREYGIERKSVPSASEKPYAYEIEMGVREMNEAREAKGLPPREGGDKTFPELVAEKVAQ